jgi:DHA2 family multidrug resistance protein-like MFS transporter
VRESVTRSLLGLAQVPLGLGCGSALATATDMVVGAGTAERAGSAAALNETAFELGGVLGIALLSRVFASDGPAQSADAVATSATLAIGVGVLATILAAGLTLRLRS